MLLDVRNLKEVTEISDLLTKCYMKALLADETVEVCTKVLKASPKVIKLKGAFIPHTYDKKDIVSSLVKGHKVEIEFINATVNKSEEMQTISEFFEAYHRLVDYIDSYTIKDVLKSDVNIVKELNELGVYEVTDETLRAKVDSIIKDKILKEIPKEIPIKSPKGRHKRVCTKPMPSFIDDFSRVLGVDFGGDDELKKFADKLATNFVTDMLTKCPCHVVTTESEEVADLQFKKCQELNRPTVAVKSSNLLAEFTFYRDGVLFKLPIPVTELRTLEHYLKMMLTNPEGLGFFHTTVESENKVVHISLFGKNKQTLRFKVRDIDDSQGANFSIHKTSKLLEHFLILLKECIKANEKLGRC